MSTDIAADADLPAGTAPGFVANTTRKPPRPRTVVRITESILDRMPAPWAVWVDMRRPGFRSSLGGPMNGQARRLEIIRQLERTFRFTAIVETGTFRGSTTEFLCHLIDGPVYTAEHYRRAWLYAKQRLSIYQSADVREGDSRAVLADLRADPSVPKSNVLFYLDAHWDDGDLPLAQELRTISDGWADSVIVMDDFEVEGDPGYGFDEYGPGMRLSRRYLPDHIVADYVLLYPAAPSTRETGSRRGCGVLVPRARADRIPELTTLTLAPTA